MKLFDVRSKTDASVIDLDDYDCVRIDALHPKIQEGIRMYSENATSAMLNSKCHSIVVFVNGQVPRWLYFE